MNTFPYYPFCNRIMSEVIDTEYQKLDTFHCYECGYSIDNYFRHESITAHG